MIPRGRLRRVCDAGDKNLSAAGRARFRAKGVAKARLNASSWPQKQANCDQLLQKLMESEFTAELY